MSTASKVAANKEHHPDKYCPVPRCLWRTGGGRCPRHIVDAMTTAQIEADAERIRTIRLGIEADPILKEKL